MKTMFILFCSFLIAPMGALSQSSTVTVFISQEPKAGQGGEAGSIADSFAGAVQNQLKIKYPCVQPIKESDIHKMLEYEKFRELLTGENELEKIGRAINAKYLINVTVTASGRGQFYLSAMMMDDAKAKTVARSGSFSSGGDAVKTLAKQFVDSMSALPISQTNCNPANLWTGTIEYKRNRDDEKTETRSTVDRSGTITTTTKTGLHYNILIRIGLKGKPQGIFALLDTFLSKEIGEKRIDCSRQGIARREPEWKSAGWNFVTEQMKYAVKNESVGVSVAVEKGRYKIHAVLPAIVAAEQTSQNKHSDGGCGSPSDNDFGPVESRGIFNIYLPTIDLPLKKTDELQGSMQDSSGGTLTWNLTRTPMRN
ncbi:MAG: hypothetical protein JXA73_15250 [Acidobacteria bacterium]|nr:hypothetical protein [Acidobacteriota bacterium]